MRASWKDMTEEEREDQRRRNRKHYHAHPEKMKSHRLASQRKNAKFVDSFKIECELCGIKDKRVLDFHHVGEKDKGVATLRVAGYSLKRIALEIAKCIVLCANCHRIVHWDEEHKEIYEI